MTSDDIADGVVAILKAIEGKIVNTQPINPPEVPQIDVEAGKSSLQVYPFDETEAGINGEGVSKRLRIVNVLVHTPINATFTRAKGLKWVEQLRGSLEGTRIERFIWQENTTETLWDFDALHDKRQFMSLFRATYYDIG